MINNTLHTHNEESASNHDTPTPSNNDSSSAATTKPLGNVDEMNLNTSAIINAIMKRRSMLSTMPNDSITKTMQSAVNNAVAERRKSMRAQSQSSVPPPISIPENSPEKEKEKEKDFLALIATSPDNNASVVELKKANIKMAQLKDHHNQHVTTLHSTHQRAIHKLEQDMEILVAALEEEAGRVEELEEALEDKVSEQSERAL